MSNTNGPDRGPSAGGWFWATMAVLVLVAGLFIGYYWALETGVRW